MKIAGIIGLVAFVASVIFASPSLAAVTFLCAESKEKIASFDQNATCAKCFDVRQTRDAVVEAFKRANVAQKCGSLVIAKLSGNISYSDAEVISIIEPLAANKMLFYVELSSNGGYVTPAMEIGDLLFKAAATVRITGNCYSACVIVAAGAVFRTYERDGQIGIHRMSDAMMPSSTANTAASLQAYFEQQYGLLEQYFEKYGVNRTFVDAMKSVPNARIRQLSIAELVQYGMGYENVAYRDIAQVRITRKCGSEAASVYSDGADYVAQCFDGPNFGESSCSTDAVSRTWTNMTRMRQRCF